MSDYLDRVLDFVRSQDDLEFSLADTLDVKASIMLVVVTFLATQSSEFLNKAVPFVAHWRYVQLGSVGLLVAASTLALFELRLKKYAARMAPEEFLAWVDKLRNFYGGDGDSESKTIAQVNTIEIEKTKVRFAENNRINVRKARMLKWCFRCTLLALALNLATLYGLYLGY